MVFPAAPAVHSEPASLLVAVVVSLIHAHRFRLESLPLPEAVEE